MPKDNNLISARKLDLGFAVDEDIINFKKNHPTNADDKISEFRSEAKCFFVAMVSKLFERSPLGLALPKLANVLDPDILKGNTRDNLQLKRLLKVIINLSVLTANSCDKTLSHLD